MKKIWMNKGKKKINQIYDRMKKFYCVSEKNDDVYFGVIGRR